MRNLYEYPNGKALELMVKRELEALKINVFRPWFTQLDGDFQRNAFTYGITIGSKDYSIKVSRNDLEDGDAAIRLSMLVGDLIRAIKADMKQDEGEFPTASK